METSAARVLRCEAVGESPGAVRPVGGLVLRPCLAKLLAVLLLTILVPACRREPGSTGASVPVSNAAPAAPVVEKKSPSTGGSGDVISAARGVLAVLAMREALTPHELTEDQVEEVVNILTKADLPAAATNLVGMSQRLFTEQILVRFECGSNDFPVFFWKAQSFRRPLIPATRGNLGEEHLCPWWRPGDLKNPRQSEGYWTNGNDSVGALLLVGEDSAPPGTVVYVRFVLESLRRRPPVR